VDSAKPARAVQHCTHFAHTVPQTLFFAETLCDILYRMPLDVLEVIMDILGAVSILLEVTWVTNGFYTKQENGQTVRVRRNSRSQRFQQSSS
jgi:hypothetical protein